MFKVSGSDGCGVVVANSGGGSLALVMVMVE